MAKEEATPDITLLRVRVLTGSLLALMMMSLNASIYLIKA
jgi:hypothetical protein